MKQAYFFLLTLLTMNAASAQDKNEQDCRLKMYAVDSLFRLGRYDKAYTPWFEARKKCPALSEKLYTTGAELIKIKIDQLPQDERAQNVKELLELYDDYLKYFPNNAAPLDVYKAMAMSRYKLGKDAEVYALLDRAFHKSPSTFRDNEAIYLYLQLYFDKYKAGDKDVTVNKILSRRDALIAQIEKFTSESPANANENNRAIDAIRRLVREIDTCENLDAYYGEVFENRKKDSLWLRVAMDAMKDCRQSKIFGKLTEAQQTLKPTAQSTYNLGAMEYSQAHFDKAAEYFIQSAELNHDPKEKADTYFTLASTIYVMRDKAKAKEFANKALAIDPKYAKSYILLAELYGNSGAECGSNEYEKKALNWLAAQTLRKAIASNPNFGSLEKLVRKYEEKAPSAKETKEAKMAGKTINYGCWINESIVVPQS